MSIAENLDAIRAQINGRAKLIAVSKFHSAQEVLEALNAGQSVFGENRVQEACEKFTLVKEKTSLPIELHLIGHLQTNKIKKALSIADWIDSIDSLKLIELLEAQCAKTQKTLNILLEQRLAEETKTGFETLGELEEVATLFEKNTFPHLRLCGLMTMAPNTSDEAKIAKAFKTLRDNFTKIKSEHNLPNFSELSMGMSGDYKIALREGSTQVRIGTAIFGERTAAKEGL